MPSTPPVLPWAGGPGIRKWVNWQPPSLVATFGG
jgi:hypothetical protein